MPMLGGNWIDFVIIVFLILALWEGWERGFFWGVIDLLGFLLSLVAAFKFYPLVGKLLILNFSFSPGLANALGFLILGVMAEIFLFSLFGFLAAKISQKNLLGASDKILGPVPALGETLVVTAFILTLLVALPVSGNLKKTALDAKIGGKILARTQGLEQNLKQVFGPAAQETLTFLTVRPESQERVDLKFTQRELRVDEAAEVKMLELVNQEREKAGLGILVLDPQIQVAARSHARDMFERGYFSHYNPEGLSPFDRLTRGGVNFGAAGENLALAPNVDLAHSGLMNSPKHRENILSPEFKRVGIGVMDGGIYGEMFVQNFTD